MNDFTSGNVSVILDEWKGGGRKVFSHECVVFRCLFSPVMDKSY